MSTYSSSLRIELITTGDQAGTWGNTTNTNLGTLIESGVCGYTSVAVASANQALTALNGVADESRNMVLALTTSTGANFAVYAPPVEKVYVIYNASSYTATIYNSTVIGNTTAAGVGVSVPAGKTVTVWSEGTNFYFQNNHLSSLTLATDLAVADGGTGASTAADARTNLGLGTMATQASSSVSITGGSITGITDLAVADGGTGASSFTSGSLIKGNGTSALSVASAADIVSAIGSTAVTNATNATSATALATGRTIGMTGDVSWTSASFNGSANVTGTSTLANTAVTAGSYSAANITVDSKGRITAAADGPAAQMLGTATTKAVFYNAQTIAENLTIGNTQNGLSSGPITIDTGYSVTVDDGGYWNIV